MHDTARLTGQLFFEVYGKEAMSVLDVGSMDVNGTLRPYLPTNASYCGIDIAPGQNVNIVLDDPYHFPLGTEEFDLVVSTSCLEHDQMFWLTFLEMCRCCKTNGFIYISAPAAGPVHRHPVDCWRFFPDSGKALETWARRNSYDIKLMESFIHPPAGEGWWDFVAVFSKGYQRAERTLVSLLSRAENAHLAA